MLIKNILKNKEKNLKLTTLGFTLIELLGVIVVIALLMLIVFPSIINSIKKSSSEKDKLMEDLIYNAADMYVEKYNDEFLEVNGNMYNITLKDLVEEGFIKSPIEFSDSNGDLTDKKCVQVTYSKGFSYEIKNNGECYESTIMNPDLMNNTLTAVVYDEEMEYWKVVDPTVEDWYNYQNQEWANAVILDNGIIRDAGDYITVDNFKISARDAIDPNAEGVVNGKKFSVNGKNASLDGNVTVEDKRVTSISGILTLNNGVTIKVDNVKSIEYIESQNADEIMLEPDALGMYVWIPRYSYTIKEKYVVKVESGSDLSLETPGAIDIKFITQKTKEFGLATYTEDSPTEWRTHPAFTFGDYELSGIWVGKFEPTHIDYINTPEMRDNPQTGGSISLANSYLNYCQSLDCEVADKIRILPLNEYMSLRSNSILTMFFAVRSMGREGNIFGINANMTDSHLMKNSEWGAVAYLTQSIYGKYGNINYEGINKEVYNNNSTVFYVGRSSGGPSGILTAGDVCSEEDICEFSTSYPSTSTRGPYGFYVYDGYLTRFPYNKISKVKNKNSVASTTGNITGIYDMVGGAHEMVMAILSDGNGNIYSGINCAQKSEFEGLLSEEDTSRECTNESNYYNGVSMPDSKYYDLYEVSDISTACNGNICYGHALSETLGWYNDGKQFITTKKSDGTIVINGTILYRGSGSSSGMFKIVTNGGQASENDTARIVLVPTR